MNDRAYQEWISVYASGTDYEADLVRDRLDDAGLPAVVLTQRDHAFNLTVGDLAQVHVLVPPEHVDEARTLLESEVLSDKELEEAALQAKVEADAHDLDEESMLDSGIERIRLSGPDEDDDE